MLGRTLAVTLCALLPLAAVAGVAVPSISGSYAEVRSCDVYTGPCFANGEMGLTGKEAMLVWNVREGHWNGLSLKGLSVIAVVQVQDTLGDLRYRPQSGAAVLIVDEQATPQQREALSDFARVMAGELIADVAQIAAMPISFRSGYCEETGCARIVAGDSVSITTRCLHDGDGVCANEELFYPPLTNVDGAYPVFTEEASFDAEGLNTRWSLAGQRSGFLATFAR